MPVFRKAKKFAGGGGMNSIFNNPGLGLGLQYIPTQQELPDLEGLMYVEESKQKALSQLESIRKERMPDVSELTKKLDETEIFGGVRDSIKQRITKDVQDYMHRMNTDPEFAFSMEARTKFNELRNKLDSGQITYHGQRFKEFNKDWEKSLDRNMGDEMYVSNQRVPVVNMHDPDDVQMIPVTEVKEFLGNERNAGKYRLFSQSKDLYDHVYNSVSENFKHLPVFSSRINLNDAKDEIEQVFKNVAHSKISNVDYADIADKSGVAVFRQLSSSVKDNADQLKIAIEQTYEGLSQQAKDALLSHYVTRTGDFSQEGFSDFFGKYLSGEANLRRNTEQEIKENNDILTGEALDMITERGQLGEFMLSQESIGLKDGQWWWDMWGAETTFGAIMGKSSLPFDSSTKEFKTFTGAEFLYSNSTYSSKSKGQPVNVNVSLYNVAKQGDYIVPVIAGTAYRKSTNANGEIIYIEDPDKTKKVKDKVGHMFNNSDGGFWSKGALEQIERVDREVQVGVDNEGNPITKKIVGYQDADGTVYEAKPQAYAVYHGFEDKSKLGRKEGTTVFLPLDPTASIQKFGRADWSKDYKEDNYFDESNLKLTDRGEKMLAPVMEEMTASIDEFTSRLQRLPADEKAKAAAQAREFIEGYNEIAGTIKNYRENKLQGKELVKALNDINRFLNYHRINQEVDKVRKNMTTVNNSFRASATYNNLGY